MRVCWTCLEGVCLAVLGIFLSARAFAGPPYVSDDPEPTDSGHYEIYLYTDGTRQRDDTGGSFGLDLNYGASENLQLTAVFPVAYDDPRGQPSVIGLGNIELAAKYRFLHQSEIGWDVAFFPRVFLPSASALVGEKHFSLLLPIWVEKDFGAWSTFGGGGCVINRSGRSHDFCQISWALTRRLSPDLQLGAEVLHQTADSSAGRATTGLGIGLKYDIDNNLHFLAYAGPGVENADETDQVSWYTSLLFTF